MGRHWWRYVRAVWGMMGVPLAIVGVAGVPDDVQGWASWLGWFDADLGRWVVLIGGLALIAGASLPSLVNRFRSARAPEAPAAAALTHSQSPDLKPKTSEFALQAAHDAAQQLTEIQDSLNSGVKDARRVRYLPLVQSYGRSAALELERTGGSGLVIGEPTRCAVTDPHGNTTLHEFTGYGTQRRCHFPSDFSGADAVSKGKYEVVWLVKDYLSIDQWKQVASSTWTVHG